MFKKLLKKTKYFIGAAGISAVALFPVAYAANPTIGSLTTRVSAGSTTTAQQIFTKNDGTVIATPDNIVDTSQLSSSNFLNQNNAGLMFGEGNTPTALEKFIPGEKKLFRSEAETKTDTTAWALESMASIAGYNPQTYHTYYSDAHKLSLYKTLNPLMAKTAVGKGTRFDFSIPKQLADIASLTSSTANLQTRSWDINKDGAFIYKVGQIDPTAIKGTLAIDYMYKSGLAGSKPKKVQMVINASDDLSSDQIDLKSIIDKKEIFFRTLDAGVTPTALDKDKITFKNSGLTLVKKDEKLFIYSSLQTIDAKSSIMVDPITTIDADAKAATIGVVGGESSSNPAGLTIPAASKTISTASDFKQFAIKNTWSDVQSYKWENGKTSAAQQMDFYMKSKSELSNLVLQSSFIATPGTLTITASEKDGKIVISPNVPYQIKPEDFVDDAKLFEVSYIKKVVNGVTWFKVTITVANSVGKSDYFLINNHLKSVGSGEDPWTLTDTQKKSPIFFRDPFATANFQGTPTVLTRKMQKLIKTNAAEEKAYKYVYGSWIGSASQTLVPQASYKFLSTNLGVVGNTDPWTKLHYFEPLKTATIYNDDKANAAEQKIPATATMPQIIKTLNDYHNHLLDIERNNLLSFDEDTKSGLGKNCYLPKDEQSFSDLLNKQFYGNAMSDKEKTAIVTKIEAADSIIKMSAKDYADTLKLWTATPGHDAYKVLYKATGPAADSGIVNFFELEKKLSKTDFDNLLKIVKPLASSSPATSGDTSVATYVQKDIEAIIPKLFNHEWTKFIGKMGALKADRFKDFLKKSQPSIDVLNPDSIVTGTTSGSHVKFADIASITTIKLTSGKDIVENIVKLVYKTGFYKTILAERVGEIDAFEKIYSSNKNGSNPNDDFWNPDKYADGSIQKLTILGHIFDGLESGSTNVEKFDDAVANSLKINKIPQSRVKLEKIVKNISTNLVSKDKNNKFSWSPNNSTMATFLQKEVILTNINYAVDYIRTQTQSKNLDARLREFSSQMSNNASISKLGPKLGRYNIEKFINNFSTNKVETAKIMEEIIHADAARVLIPDTSRSAAFEILQNQAGNVVFGLTIAAGALIFIIGSSLIGLSFTKRMIIGGRTWSIKMVAIRFALVAIAIAGVYLVLSGTVLSGHEALTQIVTA